MVGLTENSITFAGGAGAFLLNGNAITLNAGGITNNSNKAQTVNLPITLGAAQTINAASDHLVVTGDITNGVNTLTIDGPKNVTLSGVIGRRLGGLTKNGAGTLTGSANTFTGDVTINGGTGSGSFHRRKHGNGAVGWGTLPTRSPSDRPAAAPTLTYTGNVSTVLSRDQRRRRGRCSDSHEQQETLACRKTSPPTATR